MVVYATRREVLGTVASAVQSAKAKTGKGLMSLDLMRAMDTDGDGAVTSAEFLEAARQGLTSAGNAANKAMSSVKADVHELSRLARLAGRRCRVSWTWPICGPLRPSADPKGRRGRCGRPCLEAAFQSQLFGDKVQRETKTKLEVNSMIEPTGDHKFYD